MKLIYSILAALMVMGVVSCQKELPDLEQPEQYVVGSFSEEFEAFWNGMNSNYVFWDVDPTDWDAVYTKYKPLFAQLNINRDADIRKAYTYYREMTANLVDSHYALIPSNNALLDSATINPAYKRIQKRSDFHPGISEQYYYNYVYQYYMGRNGLRSIDSTAGSVMVAGKISNSVLYFHFSQFDIKSRYENGSTADRQVLQYFFNALNDNSLTGVILDLRGNGGGNLADLNFLMGSFTDKAYTFGATRSKGGPGRLDYTPWIDAKVTPKTGARSFTKPVIVITDQYSVSMAEITAMAVKALPDGNGRVVGERTWGANGPLISNVFYNGGQFSTALFNLVYTSSQMLRYKDGIVYEGVGFPPDVTVNLNIPSFQAGRDNQLERAITLIGQ